MKYKDSIKTKLDHAHTITDTLISAIEVNNISVSDTLIKLRAIKDSLTKIDDILGLEHDDF